MPNYKLTLQYDGTRYRGWQRLGDTDQTIQAKVEGVLSRCCGAPVELQASGRTDAGVHALAQVCSFRTAEDFPPETLLEALRQYLPEDVGALALAYAPERFHARLSALEKRYRYRVWVEDSPCVFQRRWVYRLPGSYDLAAMEAAARLLEGTHDFRAFSAVKTKKSTVRRLRSIVIQRQGPELWLDFTGDGFLHHMVRILTGTLLEVGRGELRPADMEPILAGECRAAAGFTVPARGLCLMELRYAEEKQRAPEAPETVTEGELCP